MNKKVNRINTLSIDLYNKIKSIANKAVSFTQGDLLFKEGDFNEYVYLIEKGKVALVKENLKHKVELLNQNDGEIVGIDMIFNDNNCGYSALAIQPSIAYRILISDFKDFLTTNNSSSLELMKYLSSLITKIESKNLS